MKISRVFFGIGAIISLFFLLNPYSATNLLSFWYSIIYFKLFEGEILFENTLPFISQILFLIIFSLIFFQKVLPKIISYVLLFLFIITLPKFITYLPIISRVVADLYMAVSVLTGGFIYLIYGPFLIVLQVIDLMRIRREGVISTNL